MCNQVVLKLLAERGYTGGRLAVMFDVSRSFAYEAISGKGSRELRVAICRIVGVMPSALWKNNLLETKVLDNFYYVSSFQLGLSIAELPELSKLINSVTI